MGCISSSEGDAGADPSSLDASTSGRWRTQVDVGTGLEFGNDVRQEVPSLGRLETRTHPLDKYDVLEKLGTGAFAVVSRVRLCGNAVHAEMEDVDVKNEYAMKVVQTSFGEVREKVVLLKCLLRGGRTWAPKAGAKGLSVYAPGTVKLRPRNKLHLVDSDPTRWKRW